MPGPSDREPKPRRSAAGTPVSSRTAKPAATSAKAPAKAASRAGGAAKPMTKPGPRAEARVPGRQAIGDARTPKPASTRKVPAKAALPMARAPKPETGAARKPAAGAKPARPASAKPAAPAARAVAPKAPAKSAAPRMPAPADAPKVSGTSKTTGTKKAQAAKSALSKAPTGKSSASKSSVGKAPAGRSSAPKASPGKPSATRTVGKKPPAKVAAPAKRRPAAVAPAIPATPAKRSTRAKTAAGPETAPTKARKSKLPQVDLLVAAAVTSLEDDKAEDVVVIDVSTRSSFADRMIVATGLADRQIQAMAAHLDKALGEAGLRRLRVEASPDWVLVDAGDLIIHLFKPEARANYRLERMWGPDSPVEEAAEVLPGVIKVTPTGETDILAEIEAVADVKRRVAKAKRVKPSRSLDEE